MRERYNHSSTARPSSRLSREKANESNTLEALRRYAEREAIKAEKRCWDKKGGKDSKDAQPPQSRRGVA
jgi:hypothetical protein